MYENILRSDFVVADISTLNPNVLYELGIRHAVRKNTTIVISENELKYPFDLNHILIESYEHLGSAIDFGEVNRFRKILKDKVVELTADPKVDSPLYTFFPGLEVPKFTEEEVEAIKENIDEDGSLSDFITEAEVAKNNKQYDQAINILLKAKALNQDNLLVVQRLALATYKSEMPNKIDALLKAESILDELSPSNSTDIETLGLSGAINKRLFEELGDTEFIKKAIWFYERGFYISGDYYNGINLAFLFNVLANLETDQFIAYAYYGNAIRIRKKVIEICKSISESENWDKRDDKEWILLTLAEAYFGSDEIRQEQIIFEKVDQNSPTSFAIDSYTTQRNKLDQLLSDFKAKYKL